MNEQSKQVNRASKQGEREEEKKTVIELTSMILVARGMVLDRWICVVDCALGVVAVLK